MNCQNCGKVLNPGEKFCTGCGTAVAAPTVQGPVQPMQNQVAQPQPIPNQNVVQPQVMPTASVQPQPSVVNQPQPNFQPQAPMNNMPGPQPMMGGQAPEPQKKNTTFIIIAAILGVIIIGLIIFLIVRPKGSDDEEVGGNTGNTPTTTTTTDNSETSTNNNNNNNDNNNNNNQVSSGATKYDGYEFSIPEKYTVLGENSGLLVISDNSQQAKLGIVIERNYSYSQTISDKESIIKSYKGQGINVTEDYEKTFGGKPWFVTEFTLSGGYGAIGHTALDNYTLMLFITSQTNSNINYDTILTDFAKVASTAKNTGVSGFSNSDTTKSNVSKFKEALN